MEKPPSKPTRGRSRATQSSTQRSPTRTSPRRSPASHPAPYHGHSTASLMGLPREVRQLLLDYASPTSKARITQLSKQLHAETATSVEKLCDLLPSKKEVSAYLKELWDNQEVRGEARDRELEQQLEIEVQGIEVQGIEPISIALYMPNSVTVVTIYAEEHIRVMYYSIGISSNRLTYVKQTHITNQEGKSRLGSRETALVSSLFNGTYPGDADPETVLGTLRRRDGCVKKDPNYGIDIVRRYILETLSVPLGKILGHEQAMHLLDEPILGQDRRHQYTVLPVLRVGSELPETKQRIAYYNTLEWLRLLACAWVYRHLAGILSIASSPADINVVADDAVQEAEANTPLQMVITAYEYRILGRPEPDFDEVQAEED